MAQAEVISSPMGAVFHHPQDLPAIGASIEVQDVGIPSTLSSLGNLESQVPKGTPSLDPSALKARYDHERDKRLAANPDGVGQYRSIRDGDPHFSHYLRDPYIEQKVVRDALDEEVEVLIVGGGYGGQLVAVRLLEKGIKDLRIIEKGGDFGGTW